MTFQEKVKNYKQLKDEVDLLEEQVAKGKKTAAELSDRLENCEKNLKVAEKAGSNTKIGLILLAVGILLFALEILLLTEVIPGFSDFDLGDLIYIIPPIGAGVWLLYNARQCRQHGTPQEIRAEIKTITDEYAPYATANNKLNNAKEKLETATEDTFLNWHYENLNNFDTKTLDQLEADFIGLIDYLSDDTNTFPLNWLSVAVAQVISSGSEENSACKYRLEEVGRNLQATNRFRLCFLPSLIHLSAYNTLSRAWNIGEEQTIEEANHIEEALRLGGYVGMDEEATEFFANCNSAMERIIRNNMDELEKAKRGES